MGPRVPLLPPPVVLAFLCMIDYSLAKRHVGTFCIVLLPPSKNLKLGFVFQGKISCPPSGLENTCVNGHYTSVWLV